jgi:hypothetical protein
VLNAQYRSVLATLEMIDAQRSLLSRPALPGQDPAWSLDQQQGQQAIEWAKVRADLDEIREMQQMLDKALEQNARWLNTPAYPGHAGQYHRYPPAIVAASRSAGRGCPAVRAEPATAVHRQWLMVRWPRPIWCSSSRKSRHPVPGALSRARRDDPKVEWQIGLAYAQLESGKYKAASKTIADAKNATPRTMPTRLPAIAASIRTTCRWLITRP